ncbi:MAG: hypothetical protein PHP69_01755 [Candidatus Omnitrophica bacterium]|jgi:predicted nuclease with TOPRIM domain|nr:hypothetical protein [Candidatus Omnitrophota bacterium]MDD5080490.1 hypothetical protein [Candidatus Omnitrophota bacterium]MDD5440750.1 hypothetical protein [Candidatus Omnitrophota bacterium]
MRDKPFIVSLLIALIVVLVIAGVSLIVKMNKLQADYKSEVADKMTVQKELEDAKTSSKKAVAENQALQDKVKLLDDQLIKVQDEMARLEKLKDKLEENLKDELIKQDSIVKGQSKDADAKEKTEVNSDIPAEGK